MKSGGAASSGGSGQAVSRLHLLLQSELLCAMLTIRARAYERRPAGGKEKKIPGLENEETGGKHSLKIDTFCTRSGLGSQLAARQCPLGVRASCAVRCYREIPERLSVLPISLTCAGSMVR